MRLLSYDEVACVAGGGGFTVTRNANGSITFSITGVQINITADVAKIVDAIGCAVFGSEGSCKARDNDTKKPALVIASVYGVGGSLVYQGPLDSSSFSFDFGGGDPSSWSGTCNSSGAVVLEQEAAIAA